MSFFQKLLAATSELTTKLLKFNRLVEVSTRSNVQRSLVFTLLLFPLVSSCKKFEVYEITKVKTLEVSSVKATEATIEGEIISIGSQPILDYGFLWSDSDVFDLETEQKASLGAVNAPLVFTHMITNLEVGKVYYVRAFVQYGQGVLMGERKTFKTLER
ncbi:MAG TPA: hypothetical protein DCS93_14540 [Microscillaceae bacterium]|nr:hypothetical protein [Microscillaceae bacterium]